MGIEHRRRHQRFDVHLVVTYNTAAEFVSEYVENLSMGGLFIANATQLVLLTEIEVEIRLPGQGLWVLRARPVFIVDEATAAASGRRAGAGMEITHKPEGYEDALLGYLLRLGRRRDVAVMIDSMPGAEAISVAGYRTVPLADVDRFTDALVHALVPIIAIVVRPEQASLFRSLARVAGAGDIVFTLSHPLEAADLIARIDGFL